MLSLVYLLSFAGAARGNEFVRVGITPDTLQLRLTHLEPGKTQISNQVWSIAESETGWVFFAESEGVLAIRGVEWRIIETPSATTVRSLAISKRAGFQSLYYGEQDDFGIVEVDSSGQFQARSLKGTIPDSISFGDVWNTHVVDGEVFFQSRHHIFKYSLGKTEVWQSENGFHNSFVTSGRYFVREFGKGLLEYSPGLGLAIIPGGKKLSEEYIAGITSLHGKGIVIWSQAWKRYVQKSKGMAIELLGYYSDDLIRYSKQVRFYTIEKIQTNIYAVGTLGAGLILIDDEARIVKVLDKSNGFPDPSINYVKNSINGGQWIALDNEGAIYVDGDLSLLKYDRKNGLSGYVNYLSYYKDRLLVATGRGLYLSTKHRKNYDSNDEIHFSNPHGDEFEQIVNSSSVWQTYELNNVTYVASESGLKKLVASDEKLNLEDCKVAGKPGTQLSVQATVLFYSKDVDALFVGTNVGLGIVDTSSNDCSIELLNLGEKIEVRSLAEDRGYLWLGTTAYGFWAIKLSSGKNSVEIKKIIKSKNHYPGRNDLKIWNNQLIGINKNNLSTISLGLNGEVIQKNLIIKGLGQSASISSVSEMHDNRAWVVLKDSLIQIELEDKKYNIVSIPEALKFPKSGSSAIFLEDDAVLWFNDGSSLVRYDPSHLNNIRKVFKTFISKVSHSNSGEIVFSGTHHSLDGQMTYFQAPSQIPSFAYDERNISIQLSANEFTKPDAMQYRYKIDGHDADWSEWDEESSVVSSSLKEGDYVFRAQAKDEVGRISEEAVYAFSILPPWFRTKWAYLGYLIAMVAAVMSAQKYVLMRRSHKDAKEQAIELERNKVVVKKLQEANDRLLQANKLEDEFLATTSHELRTPLTAILGFTNVLKDEIPVDAEYREFLNIIENSGLRLMDTLNSLLDLAKLRAGIMEVNPEKIDIYHQCEEEATKLQDLASEKGLELNVIRPNRSLFVDVDVHALSRVFHNLVSNAIKFTEAGKVEIEFYEMEKTVAMHVRDTGIGIDAKFLPDLFDAFIQESDGLSRTHEGTGLGLAICSGLMPLMNATISVESTKGVGSTFTVAIPKADLPEARRVRVKGMGSGASA